jgi:hypothetical protein
MGIENQTKSHIMLVFYRLPTFTDHMEALTAIYE